MGFLCNFLSLSLRPPRPSSSSQRAAGSSSHPAVSEPRLWLKMMVNLTFSADGQQMVFKLPGQQLAGTCLYIPCFQWRRCVPIREESSFQRVWLQWAGPEDVSLLERCPHFRGCYVQASLESGPEDVSLLERCPHVILPLTTHIFFTGAVNLLLDLHWRPDLVHPSLCLLVLRNLCFHGPGKTLLVENGQSHSPPPPPLPLLLTSSLKSWHLTLQSMYSDSPRFSVSYHCSSITGIIAMGSQFEVPLSFH